MLTYKKIYVVNMVCIAYIFPHVSDFSYQPYTGYKRSQT